MRVVTATSQTENTSSLCGSSFAGFVEKNSSGDTWARLKMMPQKGSATIILPSQAQVEAIKKRYLSESGIPRAAAAAAQSMAERGGKLASQRRGGLSMANRRVSMALSYQQVLYSKFHHSPLLVLRQIAKRLLQHCCARSGAFRIAFNISEALPVLSPCCQKKLP